jgi:16S rRNA (guanine527-N7)-methyltransferase
VTEPDWAALEAAWQPARAAGVLGPSTIAELVAHAAGFLPAACHVHDEFLGIDLGTGAGVPGVLLALARPASRWVLVDSSKRRCALAADAVAAVGLEERVGVRHIRVEDLARDHDIRGCADLVVARSFGSPPEVAECGLTLLGPRGRLVVSVTKETERRWREADSSELEFRVESTRESDRGRFIEVSPVGIVPERFPRRPAARGRRPLF